MYCLWYLFLKHLMLISIQTMTESMNSMNSGDKDFSQRVETVSIDEMAVLANKSNLFKT